VSVAVPRVIGGSEEISEGSVLFRFVTERQRGGDRLFSDITMNTSTSDVSNRSNRNYDI